MPRDNPYVLIACSSVGFSIYEYKNGKWEYRKPAKGFDETVRNIYQDTDDTFVTSYKGNGVFRIKFNETYDSVVWYKKYDADKGGGLPSNANNYLFNTGNGLTVGTIDGFYKYDRDADKYVEDVNLNKAFGGKNVYDFMYDDRVGNLWVKHVVTNKRNENIQYWFLERFTMLGDTSAYKSDKFFRPYMSRINSFGYIGDGCYIIGDKDGFIHYDSRIIKDIEGDENKNLEAYAKTGSPEYQRMVNEIARRLGLTSVKFATIEDLIESIGLPKERVCTHCFDGSSYCHEHDND
jgi:hypothetical protein